jgi:tight adherence protein C
MPSLILLVLIAFVLTGLVSFLVLSLVFRRTDVVADRLAGLRRTNKAEEAVQTVVDTERKEESKLHKAVGVVGSAVPLSPQNQSMYRRMLIQAGFRGRGALAIYVGLKIILGLSLFLAISVFYFSVNHDFRISLVLGICGLIFGLLLPNLWLNDRLKKRKTEIFHSLPDVLDLLTVCVEAGLGLDASIIKISEEKQFSKHVLAREFTVVSREIRAGKPRTEALRDLGERTGVEDIKALSALLIQTDRLGASLARSLRVHSDSLRTKRRQLAEEAAAKTTIKLVFPLALFIFPSLLVVLLGPAIIRIYTTLLGQVVK